MQKQTQFTKREIVLLIIAGTLLVTYTSFKYLISPMIDKYSSAVKEKGELEWKNQEALLYPESLESNKKILSKVKDALVGKSTLFDDRADSLKVDEEITSLLQTNGIAPLSVQIENGIKVEQGKKESSNNKNNTQDTDVKKTDGSIPAVYKFTVKVQSIGSLENAKKVFDTVSQSTDRRIVKFDVVESDKTLLNITFIVYERDSFNLED